MPPTQARIEANERHMKYGPTRTYWNDFVFEGYVHHRTEAIDHSAGVFRHLLAGAGGWGDPSSAIPSGC